MLSPPAKAGGNTGNDEITASVTVSDATGRALSGVVRFLYSDTLPDFDEMDAEGLSSGLDAAFELMVAARALSSADAPAMQHLQALCERHIGKRRDLSNVVPLLAKAVDAQYAPLQRVCHEYLANKKPASTDASFGQKLVTARKGNDAALGTAFSAAASAWFTVPMYLGTATAARIPKMMVTMINSISVKPLLFFIFISFKIVVGLGL